MQRWNAKRWEENMNRYFLRTIGMSSGLPIDVFVLESFDEVGVPPMWMISFSVGDNPLVSDKAIDISDWGPD
jgi:hypothetical protein